jgi:hypothetical protein
MGWREVLSVSGEGDIDEVSISTLVGKVLSGSEEGDIDEVSISTSVGF